MRFDDKVYRKVLKRIVGYKEVCKKVHLYRTVKTGFKKRVSALINENDGQTGNWPVMVQPDVSVLSR